MVSRTSAIDSGLPTLVSIRSRISASVITRPSCSTRTSVMTRPTGSDTTCATTGAPIAATRSSAANMRSEYVADPDIERVGIVFVLREDPGEALALVVLEQDDLVARGRDEA